MWSALFRSMMGSFVRRGTLSVGMPDGSTLEFGDGSTPSAHVDIHAAATIRRLLLFPELALGEAYMNGDITVPEDDLDPLLSVVMGNFDTAERLWWQRWHSRLRLSARRVMQNNLPWLARRNVAHHYDLSGEFFDLFLDEDRQYSCAYFRALDDTLEAAQRNKKHHIARKLRLSPDMRVLDIGCGWGGLAITLARDYGATVTAITLSEEQLKVARTRVRDLALEDRVDVQLADYRKIRGSFDRIVSVGMFEHVGLAHFDTYFETVDKLLRSDGIALIHTIGSTDRPDATNPWIAKYIFPGGYIPSLSEVATSIERSGLRVTDIEFLWRHYAETIRHWRARVDRNADRIRSLYDARFLRMWRFYLAASEQTFRNRAQAVFQFQLTKSLDAVPMTRDYIYENPAVRMADAPD
jgi:cyclopropane-fatty-acyl-phospholipid synthase